jgi:hypothetical protein
MEYQLTLTTRATKEIAARYGGIDALGNKLMQTQSPELALGEVVWLVCTLANQSIMVENLRNCTAPPRAPLTEEAVELLTTPSDLVGYKDAIFEAIIKGTKREIESESDATSVNPPSE